jgi:hypothetical protein
MKKILIISSILFNSIVAQAQYAQDALTFSQSFLSGTARMQGMASAQNALGADISSLAGNPAGLGFYRRNDFSLSPNLRFSNTESAAFGKTFTDGRDRINLGSLGFTVTQLNQDYSGGEVQNGWVSYTFGFGMNRVNNFYENRYFSGVNDKSSIAQYYAELANGRDALSFPDTNITSLEDMAWFGYVIDYDTTSNSFVPVTAGNNTQKQSDRIEGYKNEWTFAVGANYSNTLYLGASLSIGSLRYNRTSKFTESGINDPAYNLSEINVNEKLNVSGSSVNLKVGAIVRPVDFIRIGLSLQTPDYYSFDEGFITDLSTVAFNGSNTYTPLEYLFQYKLKTPFRYQGGVAFFFNKIGLISADVEMLDYANNRLSAGGEFSDFGATENAVIENIYQSAINTRFGAEVKAGPISIRAGYANYGDPFKSSAVDGSRTFITGGLGYRYEQYYVDLAFVNQQYTSQYTPYSLANSELNPIIKNNHQVNSVVLTFGTKF